MTEVVYASLRSPKVPRPRSAARVPTKVVSAPDGAKVTIVSVRAESPSFSDDLTAAFKRNVARARRENARLAGAAEG